MRIPRSRSFAVTGGLMAVALALGLSIAATDVSAQGRGGKPSAGSGGHGGWSGGSGGGRGGWSGGSGGGRGGWHAGSGGRSNWSGDGRGRGGWHGGSGGQGSWNGRHGGSNWHGGNHGHWRGHSHWRGHNHWNGWYGGRYYYPGWALGLGVGIGLTYPWWGWSAWPSDYVVYDRVVYEPVPERPVGVVIERDGPAPSRPPPGYRWYCPSPAGYHPEVQECQAGWLKVLPPDRETSPPAPAPAAPAAPRSSAPGYEPEPSSPGGPPVMGGASGTRLAAPRTLPPAQVAAQASSSRVAVFAPQ